SEIVFTVLLEKHRGWREEEKRSKNDLVRPLGGEKKIVALVFDSNPVLLEKHRGWREEEKRSKNDVILPFLEGTAISELVSPPSGRREKNCGTGIRFKSRCPLASDSGRQRVNDDSALVMGRESRKLECSQVSKIDVEFDSEKHEAIRVESISEVPAPPMPTFSDRSLKPGLYQLEPPVDPSYLHLNGTSKVRVPDTLFQTEAYEDARQEFGSVPWNCTEPGRYSPFQPGDAWQKCHNLAEKYDNDLCDAWKEEVDKLLIFAGLFSATVTAFLIESYKWLSEDSNDVAARLLAFLATEQLKAQTASNISLTPSPSVPQNLILPPFTVSASSVRINVTWFLSLVLALSTVLIGILCLQWLREYQRDAALPHKEAVALRQMRYEGLLYWKVPQILSMLPVLLQSSLVLFFAGLLDLLWSLGHFFVAGSVSAAVGLVMLFLGVTTALPAFQHAFTKDKHLRVPQCPYKSPQSWLCYCAGHILFWLITFLDVPWSKFDSPRFHRLLKSATDLDWIRFDLRWREFRDADKVVRGVPKKTIKSDVATFGTFTDTDTYPLTDICHPHRGPYTDHVHALQWLDTTFSQSIEEAILPIYHTLTELDVPTAARTISRLYRFRGQIEEATFRVMLDDRFSPLEEQKRDVIAAYYLHLRLHQDASPFSYDAAQSRVMPVGGWNASVKLKRAYVEKVLRILNSQEVPQPFYDWFSEILQEVAGSLRLNVFRSLSLPQPLLSLSSPMSSQFSSSTSSPSPSDRSRESSMEITQELEVQLLLCIKHLLPRKNSLQAHDVALLWGLLRHLLSPIIHQANVRGRLRKSKRKSAASLSSKAEAILQPSSSPHGQAVPVNEVLNADPVRHSDVEAGHHLKLACALFEALEGWVGRGKEVERLERVRICVQGVLAIFCLPSESSGGPAAVSSDSGGCADLDMYWLEGLCAIPATGFTLNHNAGDGGLDTVEAAPTHYLRRPLSAVHSLIRTLHAHMASLGGLGAIFNIAKDQAAMANALPHRFQGSSGRWQLPAHTVTSGSTYSEHAWILLVQSLDLYFVKEKGGAGSLGGHGCD
ncbi:hypothetical protein CVT26_013553, partial [Gymnopilus dilepis]